MTTTAFNVSVLRIVLVYKSDGTQERLDTGGGGRRADTFASFSDSEEGVPKQSFVGGDGRSVVVCGMLEEEAARQSYLPLISLLLLLLLWRREVAQDVS